MNASIKLHYICVDIQKTRRAKALISVASPGIRIRKNDPYFSYFTRGKILFQTSYIDAKKADIITVFFQGLLSTFPNTCPFYINTYDIFFRIFRTQLYGIFPFSAGQLQYYWIVIFEYFLIPASFWRCPSFLIIVRMFKYVFEITNFSIALQLSCWHKLSEIWIS